MLRSHVYRLYCHNATFVAKVLVKCDLEKLRTIKGITFKETKPLDYTSFCKTKLTELLTLATKPSELTRQIAGTWGARHQVFWNIRHLILGSRDGAICPPCGTPIKALQNRLLFGNLDWTRPKMSASNHRHMLALLARWHRYLHTLTDGRWLWLRVFECLVVGKTSVIQSVTACSTSGQLHRQVVKMGWSFVSGVHLVVCLLFTAGSEPPGTFKRDFIRK